MITNLENKEFFKALPEDIQFKVADVLAAFPSVHIEYYNNDYHVSADYSITAKYQYDFKMYHNKFTANEFYEDEQWYFKRWNKYCRDCKINGVKIDAAAFKWSIQNIILDAVEKYKM